VRPTAILTARFAVAVGPLRIARPVADSRAALNNMLVSDIRPTLRSYAPTAGYGVGSLGGKRWLDAW
jgi:hypothetical protein